MLAPKEPETSAAALVRRSRDWLLNVLNCYLTIFESPHTHSYLFDVGVSFSCRVDLAHSQVSRHHRSNLAFIVTLALRVAAGCARVRREVNRGRRRNLMKFPPVALYQLSSG